HARLNINEVAGLVVERLLQAGAVLVTHPALEDVEHDLEIDVDVGVGHAAGRDGGDVHRQLPAADVLGRQARLVLDAVPAAAVAGAADRQDAVAALDVLLQVFAAVRHRWGPRSGWVRMALLEQGERAPSTNAGRVGRAPARHEWRAYTAKPHKWGC